MQITEITRSNSGVTDCAVRAKYRRITELLIEKGLTITTMESCTSGQIASLITDTEGSSAILKGAFVTYSNEAKIMNGASGTIISTYGVYSAETAADMARACQEKYETDIGIGITGSFGNVDPNNADSIPGEVYFSILFKHPDKHCHCSVPPQESRYQYKMYMADAIADELLQLLEDV